MAIEITQLCKELRVLPRAGGLLDQDAYHVMLLKAGLHGFSKLAQREMAQAQSRR